MLHSLYYTVKPLIPRRLQIALRRALVQSKRKKYAHVWPIDERAGRPPEGWTGWPEGKKFALVLTHDIESAKGVRRCLPLAEMEEKLGFRSSFNFVAEDYVIPPDLPETLKGKGLEVGLHGLSHDGNLFRSERFFRKKVERINGYLREWGASGFRSPSMYRNLEWIGDLNIEYDASTFDTDPFEPQPDGAGTIFPFWVPATRHPSSCFMLHAPCSASTGGFVELPYTLPQDFLLYVIMREKGVDIWKRKLDWIADRGGMALLAIHPDYINVDNDECRHDEYPTKFHEEILRYIKEKYQGQYWNVLPKDISRFWVESYLNKTGGKDLPTTQVAKKKIWIDLDNSPHVPFFYPIINELKKRNYEIMLTARSCAQTCGLADLFSMKYRRIGRHYGKNKILKVLGTGLRGLQLSRIVNGQKPQLAVSHGSRAQMLSAFLQRIPALVIMDYEHVEGFIRPTWIMMPEIISDSAVKCDPSHLFKYPGIKEDVYIPAFKPDPGIRSDLGVGVNELLVTLRPPATEAHYHNPESEVLFSKAVDYLGAMEHVRMVILPRSEAQEEFITKSWREWCANGKIIIPKHVIDGLNLLWYSDLAISGGGTMNREAAALGVPVYSIFRGKIGDVDRHLVRTGRLVLLESIKDVETKLVIEKRTIPSDLSSINRLALKAVVDGIVKAIENQA